MTIYTLHETPNFFSQVHFFHDLVKVTSAQKMVESYKQKMAVPGYEEKVPANVREQNTMKMQAFHGGVNDTPWKINMEPTNHPFRKENDLPNLHDYVPC